jgi:hypothetical protein
MKKSCFILLLLFCLINFTCFSQSDDSIVIVTIEHNEIEPAVFPTKIKDSSILNFQSSEKGFDLNEFTISPCNSESWGNILHRISSLNYIDSNLNLEVAIMANCCSSFLGEIEIIDDSTLNLIYTENGGECFCSCCFTLNYSIQCNKNPFKKFKLNGQTIERTDRIYKKEEKTKEFHSNGEIKKLIYKVEDEIRIITYFDETGKKTKTEYYRNGKVFER